MKFGEGLSATGNDNDVQTSALEAAKGHAHQLSPCKNGPILKYGGGNDELRMNLLVGVGRRGLDGGVAAHDGARRDLGDDGGADEECSHLACGG